MWRANAHMVHKLVGMLILASIMGVGMISIADPNRRRDNARPAEMAMSLAYDAGPDSGIHDDAAATDSGVHADAATSDTGAHNDAAEGVTLPAYLGLTPEGTEALGL